MRYQLVVVLCASAVLAAGTVSAETVTLTPSIDNTIYETAHNLSNGLGESIFAGNNVVWQPRRALIAFPIDTIPAGALITSVQLELQLTKAARDTPDDISLHRLTQQWGEGLSDAGSGGIGEGEGDGIVAEAGDATWSHAFYDTEEWTTLGGTFVAQPSATTSAGAAPASLTWGSTPQMVADVQGWVDDPPSNAGWILVGNETPGRTARVFSSKDHPTESQRPRLTVEFTPQVPVETGSVSRVKAEFKPPED